ncbi:hypothetical protein PWT90_10910 [Aphanocladium album]|nr:hypothetical protein PWT90_10910 [Aphanocladium album]
MDATPRRHGRRHAAAVHSLADGFFEPLASQLRLFLAPLDLYGAVKATMLADGHAVGAGLVVAAVLVNHIRRVLAPWLGQFLWWHPVQVMKLARGTPHYFVEDQLLAATDGAALALWLLQTGALAATRALLRHRLLTTTTAAADLQSRGRRGKGDGGSGGASGGGTESKVAAAAAGRRTTASLSACFTDCGRISYLALCLMQVEYAYAEACWAASWTHAATHVYFRGTTAEKQFVHRLFAGDWHLARPQLGEDATMHWRGMMFIASLLAWWAWRIIQPLRRHGVVGVALSGLPILGGFIGAGTAHIIRYSNKYFIWLEISEMLLTWVWLLLGVTLVAAWRLCDGQSPE